jgi:hypothetical protein
MSVVEADFIASKRSPYVSINQIRSPVYSWEAANKAYVDSVIPSLASGSNPGFISGAAQTLGGALTLTSPLHAPSITATNVYSTSSYLNDSLELYGGAFGDNNYGRFGFDVVDFYIKKNHMCTMNFHTSGLVNQVSATSNYFIGILYTTEPDIIPARTQNILVPVINNNVPYLSHMEFGTNFGTTVLNFYTYDGSNYSGKCGIAGPGFTVTYSLQ